VGQLLYALKAYQHNLLNDLKKVVLNRQPSLFMPPFSYCLLQLLLLATVHRNKQPLQMQLLLQTQQTLMISQL
jgi:hypothetical protein